MTEARIKQDLNLSCENYYLQPQNEANWYLIISEGLLQKHLSSLEITTHFEVLLRHNFMTS